MIAPTDMLRISWYTRTGCLGPENRFALWLQGCNKNCKGCIAEGLRDTKGGQLVNTRDMAEQIINSGTKEITISGGEPFLQAKELAKMLEAVKAAVSHAGVIIYTGCKYEELIKDPDTSMLIGLTDLIIDGEYISSLDDGKPMRGSSNQRMIFVTDRYSAADMPQIRCNEIVFTDKGYRIIGIPSNASKQFMEIYHV